MSVEGPWTDSHCHLAMEAFDGDRAQVLERARAAGVSRAVLVGTHPGDWEPSAALAFAEGLKATAGLHPHEASLWASGAASDLRVALSRSSICAVGEIGLDYHYDLSERGVQRRAFSEQVRMAVDLGLPVVVHSRSAFEDTEAVLREAGAALRGVIHCFTYGIREAEAFLALGLHLSFSGIATFPKAAGIREALSRVPPGRLLLETDAPYLAPPPFRGKRCEPAHVAVVGGYVAQYLGKDVLDLARTTSENARRLFELDRS
ncbi:MAG: TatD family hydrolase [Acidobacteriota bacterium]